MVARAQPIVPRDLERDIGAAKVLKAHLSELLGEDAVDAITLRDAIEGETDLFETINAVVAQVAEDEAAQAALKLYASRIESRASRLGKRAELLRVSLMNALDMTGDKSLPVSAHAIAASITARALAQLSDGKIDAGIATLTAKRVPQKLQVTDEALIPSRFFRQPEPEIDKKAVTDALKAGEEVPGAELSNGGMTVQIRLS